MALLGSLGDFCPVSKFAAMESQVIHGPKRIDEAEIVIQGELGEFMCGDFTAFVVFIMYMGMQYKMYVAQYLRSTINK